MDESRSARGMWKTETGGQALRRLWSGRGRPCQRVSKSSIPFLAPPEPQFFHQSARRLNRTAQLGGCLLSPFLPIALPDTHDPLSALHDTQSAELPYRNSGGKTGNNLSQRFLVRSFTCVTTQDWRISAVPSPPPQQSYPIPATRCHLGRSARAALRISLR
jgi:hypothetical protein